MQTEQDEGRYIPAHVRREVLLEAGHACAIPTCQFPATEFAHIDPYAEVKAHDVSNIIALCPNHHHLFDQKKQIDRKSMKAYKLKLQFLNKRYTKYELRLLAILSEKPVALALGEAQTSGLLMDGLVENIKTFASQSVELSGNDGQKVYEDNFVLWFAARLTPKGQEFVDVWKSSSESLLEVL